MIIEKLTVPELEEMLAACRQTLARYKKHLGESDILDANYRHKEAQMALIQKELARRTGENNDFP